MTEIEELKFAVKALRKKGELHEKRIKQLELSTVKTKPVTGRRSVINNPMYWLIKSVLENNFEFSREEPLPREVVFVFCRNSARAEGAANELTQNTLGKVLKQVYGEKIKRQVKTPGKTESFYNLKFKD